jgi:hypothetical protein
MRVFQIQDDWGMANLQMAERPRARPREPGRCCCECSPPR